LVDLARARRFVFRPLLPPYANCGVLFAAHCYGWARSTSALIYSLRRDADGTTRVTPLEATPRLAEFLGELSYSGYSELGFEKVLLVEGSTDVKTIQQFLRKISKDHQIVLLPLGGGQLITNDSDAELLEIKRICNNLHFLKKPTLAISRPG